MSYSHVLGREITKAERQKRSREAAQRQREQNALRQQEETDQAQRDTDALREIARLDTYTPHETLIEAVKGLAKIMLRQRGEDIY